MPLLALDPQSAVPIWSQIEEGVRRLVARGTLAAGGPVPSVRELARDLRVNPATVSKAYGRLVDAGVLEVRRGEGTFVRPAPPRLGAGERREILRRAAERYAHEAVTLGLSPREVIGMLEEVLAGTHAYRPAAAVEDGAGGERGERR